MRIAELTSIAVLALALAASTGSPVAMASIVGS